MDVVIDNLLKKFDALKSKRQVWESLWQDIASYTVPRKDNILIRDTPGTKKYNDILDSTAINSVELLSGALHSMLTNPVGFFFNLTTGDSDLDNQDEVRAWFQQVVRVMHETLANSNFQTEVHEYYIDLVSFGTAVLLIEDDPEDEVRFSSKAIQEVYLDKNHIDRVDTVFREFKYTPRDLVDAFGLDILPAKIKKEYNEGVDRDYDVIHATYPKKKEEKSNFAFHSKYILRSEKMFLQEGGFRQNPYIAARWSKSSCEVYGRGPGEKGLPETRLANLMGETTIRSAQKVIDPPMQAPDDGFVFPLITRPGGLNFYRAGSQDRIEPIFNNQRIDYGIEMTEATRAKIREAFFVDQLKLRDGPQMTATEVMERSEQAMRFLGPMLGRQEVEFLQPMVTRLFDLLERKEKLPAVPESIKAHIQETGRAIRVRFSSVMAMSQRQSEVQNINRTMQTIAPFASANPQVLDNLDGDKAVRYIAKLFNFPQELIMDTEGRDQMREQRAQQQQQQQQAEQEAQQADSASKIMNATKTQ